jgi:hypothetical protein
MGTKMRERRATSLDLAALYVLRVKFSTPSMAIAVPVSVCAPCPSAHHHPPARPSVLHKIAVVWDGSTTGASPDPFRSRPFKSILNLGKFESCEPWSFRIRFKDFLAYCNATPQATKVIPGYILLLDSY